VERGREKRREASLLALLEEEISKEERETGLAPERSGRGEPK